MRKKMLTAIVCVAMSMALCACNTTDPVVSEKPTGTVTNAITLPTATAGPTATPTEVEEAYASLPITNYDDYVASTVLPEGYIGFEVEKITDHDVDVYIQNVTDLKSLEAQGVEIVSCGTCLDFYGVKEKLAVGSVTNMYDIVERMETASSIVKPS